MFHKTGKLQNKEFKCAVVGAGVAGGPSDVRCGWSWHCSPELDSIVLEAMEQDRTGG